MPKLPFLAEREHQIMQALWERGEATSEDVRAALPVDPPLREVTVRTMLRKMEAKGYVEHRVEGRTFVYRGLLAPDQERSRALRYILERFFGGSVGQLMRHLTDSEELTDGEIEEMRERIGEGRSEGVEE